MTTASGQLPPPSATRWIGWAGVVAILLWMALAAARSTRGIEHLEGPVSFELLALALLGAMMRWFAPVGSSVFMRFGAVVLLAWLVSAWAGAWSMNWGAEPWLIAMVQTFQHLDDLARFVVVAVAVAALSSVPRRREMWILGPLAVVVGVVDQWPSLPSTVLVGGVWWAGRVIRGVATRRFTMTIAVITALGTAPESVGRLCGYGGSYGRTFFVPFMLPLVEVVACPIAFVGLAVAGGVALRRRRVALAGRLWAAGLGFGGVAVGALVLGGCSDVVLGTGPLLLFVAVGPRTRWSTLLWGVAGAFAPSLVAAWRYDSAVFVGAPMIVIAGATAAFTVLHRSVMARQRRP
jgi:hypothetical protein